MVAKTMKKILVLPMDTRKSRFVEKKMGWGWDESCLERTTAGFGSGPLWPGRAVPCRDLPATPDVLCLASDDNIHPLTSAVPSHLSDPS